jgi:hypothetical protein
MSATILVLNHPYFTTPQLDGTYTLADVPPERYTVVGWHERSASGRLPFKWKREKQRRLILHCRSRTIGDAGEATAAPRQNADRHLQHGLCAAGSGVRTSHRACS